MDKKPPSAMREINCIVCGKKVIDNSHNGVKRFCGVVCRRKHQTIKAGFCIETECLYNNGVLCADHKCDKCGWNPEVERARKEKYNGQT